jgi:hypothetical protein
LSSISNEKFRNLTPILMTSLLLTLNSQPPHNLTPGQQILSK